MAKKHKQHQKKRAKRARQAARSASPSVPEARRPDAAATDNARVHEPEKTHAAVQPDAAPPAAPVRGVTASFSTTTARTPEGVDTATAAAELPAIRRDMRKLAVTILFYAGVIAALTLLNQRTTVISDLGDQLFSWWQ